MASSVSFTVSYEDLNRLASQLKAVVSDMQGIDTYAAGYGGDSGSVAVDSSISNFISTWHDGVGHIKDNVNTAAQMLSAAADAYCKADAAICHAASQGSAPPAGGAHATTTAGAVLAHGPGGRASP